MSQGYTQNFTKLNPKTHRDVLPFRKARSLTEIVREVVAGQTLLETQIDELTATITAHITNYNNPHDLDTAFIQELYWESLYWIYQETLSSGETPLSEVDFLALVQADPNLQMEIIRLWQITQSLGSVQTTYDGNALLTGTNLPVRGPITLKYVYGAGVPNLFFPYTTVAGTDSGIQIYGGNFSKAKSLTAIGNTENIGYGIWPSADQNIMTVMIRPYYFASTARYGVGYIIFTVGNCGVIIALMGGQTELIEIGTLSDDGIIAITGTPSILVTPESTTARTGMCFTLDGVAKTFTMWYWTTTGIQSTTMALDATLGADTGLICSTFGVSDHMLNIYTMDPTISGSRSVATAMETEQASAPLIERMEIFQGYPDTEYLTRNVTPL